jgi:hypothetical protein
MYFYPKVKKQIHRIQNTLPFFHFPPVKEKKEKKEKIHDNSRFKPVSGSKA